MSEIERERNAEKARELYRCIPMLRCILYFIVVTDFGRFKKYGASLCYR